MLRVMQVEYPKEEELFVYQTSSKRFKKLCLIALCFFTFAGASVASVGHKASAAGEMRPFPQQVSYSGVIKPNHVSQASMNQSVASYYDYWKATYLKNNLSSLPGGYYVSGGISGDSEGYNPLGSSEGQGYGMVITALMAGYDPNAKTIYDGLFKTARTFKSSINSNLMGWVVADSKSAQGHFDSATDGDVDIAYSLILAHNQWGSNGAINYLAEAKKMITDGIKASNVTNNYRLNLGDWDSKGQTNTRPSDWMLSHLRAFYEVTGDNTWLRVIDSLYNVYNQFIASYSPNTGLISDFVVGDPPKPAPKWYLDESAITDQYYYNACRVPLRIVMDYALYGDTRSKTISDKIATWIKGKTGGKPSQIKNGYNLDGSNIGDYPTAVFVSPLVAAGVASSSNQAWVNAGWDWMKNAKEDYFSDSYNLMTMLFLSGNWWKPGNSEVTPPPTDPTDPTDPPVSNPVSVDIVNPGFEDGNLNGWTEWHGGPVAQAVDTDYPMNGSYKLTHWASTAYQQLTYQHLNVPNGTYSASVSVRSGGGQNVLRFFARNFGADEMAVDMGSSPIVNYTKFTIDNIQVTNGQIEIGIWNDSKANNWAAFDNFELVKSN